MRNKYTVLAACAAAMLSTGMNYVWSVLQVPVMGYYAVDPAAASKVFYLFVTFNVIGIFIGGRAFDRLGPRIPVLIGSCLYIAGLFASSFVPKDKFTLLYITYSGLLSFGGGLVYPCTISCAQQWWPDKKGFASGFVLSMLGASTLVLTPAINAIIAGDPERVPYAFSILGMIFSVVLIASYPFIQSPAQLPAAGAAGAEAPGGTAKKREAVKEILKGKTYYMLLFCIAVGPIGYFTVNPYAKILGAERGLSESFIVSMIMASGAASAMGRLVFGKLCDNFGARNAASILYCITIGVTLGLSLAGGFWFFMLVIILSFAFGGFAGITPMLAVDYYGSKYIGTVISMLSVAVLISSFASPVIVDMFSAPEGNLTTWNFIICAVLALAGLVVARISRDKRDDRPEDIKMGSGPAL
jgi:OFA family oxalate/formate antiporter-like MFS transporter